MGEVLIKTDEKNVDFDHGTKSYVTLSIIIYIIAYGFSPCERIKNEVNLKKLHHNLSVTEMIR